MKKVILVLTILIATQAVNTRSAAEPTPSQQQVVSQADPDYCAGIACTEETDSCCDESVK